MSMPFIYTFDHLNLIFSYKSKNKKLYDDAINILSVNPSLEVDFGLPLFAMSHCQSIIDDCDETKSVVIKLAYGSFKVKVKLLGDDSDLYYFVKFGDQTSYPSCTCFGWRSNPLPCLHMFHIFKQFSLNFDSLSPLYRSESFFMIDYSCFKKINTLNKIRKNEDIDSPSIDQGLLHISKSPSVDLNKFNNAIISRQFNLIERSISTVEASTSTTAVSPSIVRKMPEKKRLTKLPNMSRSLVAEAKRKLKSLNGSETWGQFLNRRKSGSGKITSIKIVKSRDEIDTSVNECRKRKLETNDEDSSKEKPSNELETNIPIAVSSASSSNSFSSSDQVVNLTNTSTISSPSLTNVTQNV